MEASTEVDGSYKAAATSMEARTRPNKLEADGSFHGSKEKSCFHGSR